MTRASRLRHKRRPLVVITPDFEHSTSAHPLYTVHCFDARGSWQFSLPKRTKLGARRDAAKLRAQIKRRSGFIAGTTVTSGGPPGFMYGGDDPDFKPWRGNVIVEPES